MTPSDKEALKHGYLSTVKSAENKEAVNSFYSQNSPTTTEEHGGRLKEVCSSVVTGENWSTARGSGLIKLSISDTCGVFIGLLLYLGCLISFLYLQITPAQIRVRWE